MKHSREFEIAWMGLKPGVHQYQYTLTDDFMRAHDAPEEYRNWTSNVALRFDKHESFFMLHFDVGGAVTLACDRCGDEFEMPLWDEFDLLIKLSGDDEEGREDEDADVVFIPRSETVINISEWLYEFTMLALPLQRIHPNTAEGAPGCNPEALKLLGDLAASEESAADEAHQPSNTIWKGLEALRQQGESNPTTTQPKSSDHAKS